MEQGYAFRPSAPAPLSAAPPPSGYPREAFGTRSSMDISSAARLSGASPRKENMADDVELSANTHKSPHVLFDQDTSDNENNGDSSR